MSLKQCQSRIFKSPNATLNITTYLGVEDILVEGNMIRIVKEEI
jgi:hypothetical protein